MIDQLTIDKIKDAANAKDILEDYGYDLVKKGTKYHCLCPFHDDHNLGSFVVNPVKGTYACYSCGARGNSIDFLMHHEHMSYIDAIKYLGKKYDIYIEGSENIVVKKSPPRPPTPPKQTLVLPRRLVSRSRKDIEETNFVKWLRGLPWDGAQRARIDDVLRLYAVGPDRDRWMIFWQVDDQGRVLNGKLMKYRADGHRDKGEEDIAKGRKPFTTDWIHSRLKRKRKPEDPWPHPEIFNPDIQEEHYTFFGMHLLNRYPKAVINVVESEKTAIICAIAYGAMDMNLWMACGGKTMLSNERMEPLFAQKRQIVLWPDTDGLDEWAEWIKLMNRQEISIQREFFARYYREELDGKKADVSDLLIRWMDESIQGTHHYENAEVVAELTEKTERLTTGTVQAIEEPFIDPEELADPRLHWMRETLRRRYNFNKRRKTNDRRTKTT